MCSFFAIHRQKYARNSGAKVDDPLKNTRREQGWVERHIEGVKETKGAKSHYIQNISNNCDGTVSNSITIQV